MGAGNLGTALLGYKKFREYGLQIVAVFDAAPSRVGERLHDLEVQPLERLPELAREWNAQIGIVTVPVAHAQQAVNLLVPTASTRFGILRPCGYRSRRT